MEAYVAVGANLEPDQHIPRALHLLRQQVPLLGISTFYRTPAIGRPEQPDYLNGLVCIEATCTAHALKFEVLRPIEAALGRVRGPDRHAARPIDLDVLSFGNEIIQTEEMVIPDPDLRDRAFLLHALRELCPAYRLPGTGETLDELLAQLDAPPPAPDLDFTHALRENLKR